jgi:hypothetical protein
MRAKILIPVFGVLAIAVIVWFCFKPIAESERPPATKAIPSAQGAGVSNEVVTNASALALRKLLVSDYHSTNAHVSVSSLLAHQLIAERLNTNEAFLEWATNAATTAIMRFVTNTEVPVYGAQDITPDSLEFDKVTADAPRGLEARAYFDPDPTNEGPLEFVVEGGVNPTIMMVRNTYRMESYQLDPDLWKTSPRHIGRMGWSGTSVPLDKKQVDTMAQNAFYEMTGRSLNSFNVGSRIATDKILNHDAVHPGVTVTGNLNAKLFTPQDYVYPFATFQYGDSNFTKVPFQGEMVQSAAGKGEFVELLVIARKQDALFELGEKFFGQGNWEQDVIDGVNSMNTEQRGQVYQRVFKIAPH